MASKPATSEPSSAVRKLEEQLTCPVCLDLYTNPKTLPCLHSFCEACIERFPQDKEGETYYISCPTCRHRTELPGGGAGAFPVAFTLNNFKEVHSLLKKVSDPQQVTCDNCNAANATGYCKECSQFFCTECIGMHKKWARFASHQITSLDEVASAPTQLLPAKQFTCSVPSHDEPLKYYCDTCDESICRDCAILTHKDHKYNLMAESYTKHRRELECSLNPVKGKIEALKKVLSAIAEREGEIRERGEGVLEEIHEMVEEMMNVLRESERKLSEEAKRVTDAKLEVLSGQAKSAQISLSLLEHIKDYVEESVKTGTHQQVLSSKKQMMERMSEVTTQINVEELEEPKEKADFVLSKDIKSLHHIGDIISGPTALQQCKMKKIGHLVRLPKEKNVSFSLSIKAPDSSLVSVPISSLKCSLVPVGKGGKPIHTTVTTTSTHPGVYRIHCNPSTSGTHTVKVQVHDVPLEDTSLVIPFNPYLDSITPVRTITELKGPWGVAVSNDGYVIVTEWVCHCVTILDKEGKKVKSFGGEGGSDNVNFSRPRGVAITPDSSILIVDNHRIQKISMDGKFITSVGAEKGNGQLQFHGPVGIAISPVTGHIFITDCYNHRIIVLTSELVFSHSFGSKGAGIDGEFNQPMGIDIDYQGLLYVADWGNHRIQKFTPDGKFLAQFGSKGSDPGQLCNPTEIAVDNGLVYVSEYHNSHISVFTSDGVFVHSFGGKGKGNNQFDGQRGMTYKDGFLYVCDRNNGQIVIY